MKPAWLGQDASGSLILRLHVQPGARKTEVVGLHGEVLKVRLAAAPVEGKANAALIVFLAEALGVTRRQVELLGGAASRDKRLRISGATGEAVAAFLSRIG
ncbi:MAG: hypothetical protein EFKGCFLK_00336 [Rhodocyclaceae bacterium]|nr:MAG: YggU family protein [Rhodocyclaceae bacterium]MBE7423074.1 YggU family protein [Zoogloeaceae bacterium]MBV6406788.1 hypothetical protein [Rhodocyclaceae bacterium]MCK6384548.1 DUF167 family protein [Rhodocyclaceae bacterium]CAG0931142.1 hypothetical protein RHDC3_01776 [Rhodocyclaceae bacterium]